MKSINALPAALIALLLVGQLSASENIYQSVLRSAAFVIAGDSLGSGALVDADRKLVFTNYHVVGEEKNVRVMFPQFEDGELVTDREAMLERRNQDGIAGKVIETDPRRDLALIQLDSVPSGVEPIKLAPRSAGPGQTVHSIGNPGTSMAMWLYTSGTVRQVYRRKFTLDNDQQVRAYIIETDQPINKGDSGGPVVNGKGELVAVVSAFSKTGNLVSLAIDIRELKSLLNGDNSTADRRVKDLAEREGWKYAIRPDGAFMVDIPTRGRVSQVRVESRTSEYLGVEFRSVTSLGTVFEGSLDSGLAEKLMFASAVKKFGAWQIDRGTSSNFLMYKIDIPENTSEAVLRAAILGAANITAEFRDSLNDSQTEATSDTNQTSSSSVSTPNLTGTWTATLSDKNKQLNFRVTFGEDGTIAWIAKSGSKEVLNLRGKFEVQGDELRYLCDGTQYKGKIKVLDNARMTFDDGSIKLTLIRGEAAAAPRPPAAPKATLIGSWINVKQGAAGSQTTTTMSFTKDKFSWNAKVGQVELINLTGTYTLQGNTLKMKAAAGVTFQATITLQDENRMSFKDATNDLEMTRS